MADTSKLLEALSAYTGDQTTLESFVQVAKQELGEDWSNQIHATLPNLPAHLKEKLDHAYNYYGASLSWTEIQSYLQSQDPLNVPEISARVETLSYWLNFFGEAGTNAVEQLKQKLEDEAKRQEQSLQTQDPLQDKIAQEQTNLPLEEDAFVEETAPKNAAMEDDIPYEAPFADIPAEEQIDEEPSSYEETAPYPEEYQPSFDESTQEGEYSTSYDQTYQDDGLPYQEEYPSSYDETTPYQEETYQSDEQNLYMDNESYENTGYEDSYINGNSYEVAGYQDSYDNNGNYETDSFYDSEGNQGNYGSDSFYNGEGNQDYYEGDSYQDSYGNQEYFDEDGSFWQEPVYTKQESETIEEFMAKKAFHQVDFLNAVQCWINARCIALGKKEIYTYRHYGFLVDLMEETKKDVQEVLSAPKYYPAIETVRADGLKKLQRFITSLENDLKTAYDNLPSELTDLISDSTNADDLRKMLGAVDTSNKPELLGAAPDGFEMLEDPFEGTSIAKEMKKKTTPQTPAGTTSQPSKKSGLSFTKKTAL